MKTINVSDEMYDFLINLSKEINTQNNRATAMPYFYTIQTKKRIYVPEGCGMTAWHRDDNLLTTDEEIIEKIADNLYPEYSIDQVKAMSDWDKADLMEKFGYEKVQYDWEDQYENAFLTEKACREHIKSNDHHYNEPVDYLQHAFRNPELETLIKFLVGLTR